MNIEIYTTLTCRYCIQAKKRLDERGLPYTEIHVGGDTVKLIEMVRRSGRRTVPQIFFDGESIGGYDELKSLFSGNQAA